MDISSMLEVEVQEVADSKENVTPVTKRIFPCQNFSSEENDFYKLTYGVDIASVRFLKLHCTTCDEHIGSAPAEVHNIHEHPVLRTLLCAKCREFYGDGTFEQGNDNTDMYCRWCANGGNLYCCSYCSNTFCSKCIRRNLDAAVIKKIETDDNWKCFVCDPKDLYPLRSICRALKTHIETLTRILENEKCMDPKEIEEKKHLDETKCCSRKRKRRRRTSCSEDDNDDDDDDNYDPDFDRVIERARKRRSRAQEAKTLKYSSMNGGTDHEYHRQKIRLKSQSKEEPAREAGIESGHDTDHDPTDLLIPCEQTMIEGDSAIFNHDLNLDISQNETSSESPINRGHAFQTSKNAANLAINPVPLATLLRRAISESTTRKIKILHTNKKLVPVPLPSNLTLVKPTGRFIMPKTMQPFGTRPTFIKISNPPVKPVEKPIQPSVIDLDSDNDEVIVEKDSCNKQSSISKENDGSNMNIAAFDETEVTEAEVSSPSDENIGAANMNTTTSRNLAFNQNTVSAEPLIHEQGISLKTQKRDERFKQMLKLQGQEIDNTVSELKTKILKLIQTSTLNHTPYNRPLPEETMLNSALTCTKRFHRILKKTMAELAHINDRVVRDYVHWKKKTDLPDESGQIKQNDISSSLPVEMVCERESESEGEEEAILKEDYSMEANNVPTDFSNFLDHMSIFKRKPMAIKGVGDNSVLTEDKGCQAYDVPWRDYEKCIGYSLVKKDNTGDPNPEEQIQPDENFGKYQEQFLFYLQHIEDIGIETDDFKGLADPNQIPLKELIDTTSPFIMDMLERLSPVALINGCTPTTCENLENSSNTFQESSAHIPMDVSQNEEQTLDIQTDVIKEQEVDKSKEKSDRPTVKAVQELVKMVTKLSEDLCTEDPAKRKEVEEAQIDDETFKAVQSILETNHDEPSEVPNEIMEMCSASSTECVTLD